MCDCDTCNPNCQDCGYKHYCTGDYLYCDAWKIARNSKDFDINTFMRIFYTFYQPFRESSGDGFEMDDFFAKYPQYNAVAEDDGSIMLPTPP